VRLAGCNLQCPGCDTEYTEGRQDLQPPGTVAYSVKDLAGKAFAYHTARLVVITGGEPFRQDIRKLVEILLDYGFEVQIETNGSLYLEGIPYGHRMLTIVCSPKAGKIAAELADKVDYFKYVVKREDVSIDDGLPLHALDHPAPASGVARPPKGFPPENIYVNPMDEKSQELNELNLQEAVRSSLAHGYTLGLQIHKLINLP
jgi:organic radical activating enzyme